MKALQPGSFGHRGCLGKKVEAREANRVSAKCAICDMRYPLLRISWGLGSPTSRPVLNPHGPARTGPHAMGLASARMSPHPHAPASRMGHRHGP
jgi:hypothetical protein